MRKWMPVLAGLLASLGLTAAAEAATGFTMGDVNMRAGPGTGYPRIMVLPAGAEVEVYGCLQGYSWCDVGFYRERGWVSSRYLSIFYDDRRVYYPYRPRVIVPSITFGFGYWDDYYYDRPWYRTWRHDRRRWDDNDRPNDRNDPPRRNDPRPRWRDNDRVEWRDENRNERPRWRIEQPRDWDNDRPRNERPRGGGGDWCGVEGNCVYRDDGGGRGRGDGDGGGRGRGGGGRND